MSLINKSKQYKTVIDDWKYILRFNDTNKTISRTAKDILFSALYQIEKYGQAIFTHDSLELITDVKRHQNLRLLKQLGYVFDWNFSRRLVVKNKKYNDAYQITLKKNAEEILQNPKKYFTHFSERSEHNCSEVATKDWSKNALTSEQKCSEIGAKKLRSPESLHIYNKNKDKINDKINSNQNQANQNPFLEEKIVETTEPKIANSEYAEKPHNRLAKEECVDNAQAKNSTAEPVENGYFQLGEPILLLNYVFTDAMLLEAIKASDKKHYTPNQVKVILRNLLEKYPGKIIFGGNRGFIKYLTKVINGETDYEYQAKYHLSKLDKATTMAEIQAEKQKAIDKRFQLLLQGKVKSLSRAEEYYG